MAIFHVAFCMFTRPGIPKLPSCKRLDHFPRETIGWFSTCNGQVISVVFFKGLRKKGDLVTPQAYSEKIE